MASVAALAGALSVASGACLFGGDDKPDARVTPTASPESSGTVPPTRPATASPTPSAPSADLASARELFREGRYGAAREAFQALAARATEPAERAEALLGAGTAAFELNDGVAGLAALREAAGVAPKRSGAAARSNYLLMKHLTDSGQPAAAAEVFDTAPEAGAGSPLEAYYLHEGARALLAVGRSGEASTAWARALAVPGASAALGTAILQAKADSARAGGDPVALASALDALIAATGDPAARSERAQLAVAAGDTATAVAQWRTLVAKAPASRHARLALEELERVDAGVDPGQAGLTYYRHGMYAQAKATLGPAIASAPTAEDLAFRAFYLAASYEDTGAAASAVEYYDRAAGSEAASPFVHRAMYWAARVVEGEGDAAGASQRYVALVASGIRGEFTEEAAFRAGFVLFDAGRPGEALAAWDRVAGAEGARLEYWRGRALAGGGDNAGARAAFARAVALGPLELYGMEAANELAGRRATLDVTYRVRDLSRGVDWAVIAGWLGQRVPGGPAGSTPTAACELANIGLRAAASAEIREQADGAGAWRLFELVREANECGLTDVAAQLAVSLRVRAGAASHEVPKDLLRVSYPVDYVATLRSESLKANLDPLFFAALVRQESFWDPAAGSVAGALGLTQVIPPTGEAIAGSLGVVDFSAADLFRPALSLEFGAYYLGGQVSKYGDPLLALAAYNAGPGAASRWGAAGTVTAAGLVEEIDFLETKTYVTYIVEAYAHYQLAWE